MNLSKAESTGPSVDEARFELWEGRAQSLRNVCAMLAFACFAVLAYFVPLGVRPQTLLAVGVAGLVFVGAARLASRRPFAIALTLTAIAGAAWVGLMAVARATETAGPVQAMLAFLAYWPLVFLLGAIEARGADRWIRAGRPAQATGTAEPRGLVVLRAITTPLGWALITAHSVWIGLTVFDIWERGVRSGVFEG